MNKTLLAICAVLSFSSIVRGGEISGSSDEHQLDDNGFSVIGFNIYDPIQLPCAARDIYGLRLNILNGSSQRVYGLDLGLIGITRGQMYGVEAQVFNWNDHLVKGVQIAGIANVAMQNVQGFQVSGIANINHSETVGLLVSGGLNISESFSGVQFSGLANYNNDNSAGIQVSFVNSSRNAWKGASIGVLNYTSNITGVQIGVINFIQRYGTGFQLGLFNAAQQFHGLQIGVLNMICNGYTPMLPVANFNF